MSVPEVSLQLVAYISEAHISSHISYYLMAILSIYLFKYLFYFYFLNLFMLFRTFKNILKVSTVKNKDKNWDIKLGKVKVKE